MKIVCVLPLVALSGCSLLVPGNDGLTPDLGADAGYDAGPMRDAGPAAPDLTIACGTPADIVQSGDVVRVPWTASNVGLGPAQPFTVAVLMEMPAMVDGEVDQFVELGTERYPGQLDVATDQSGEVAFMAPDWILGGSNALRCVVDSLEETTELDEMNNSDDAFVAATALPDLTLQVPDFVRETNGTLSYRFYVRNAGTTAARRVPWRVLVDACDGDIMETGVVPFIAPGAVSALFQGNIDNGGCLSQSAINVDLARTIVESDETNNIYAEEL